MRITELYLNTHGTQALSNLTIHQTAPFRITGGMGLADEGLGSNKGSAGDSNEGSAEVLDEVTLGVLAGVLDKVLDEVTPEVLDEVFNEVDEPIADEPPTQGTAPKEGEHRA